MQQVEATPQGQASQEFDVLVERPVCGPPSRMPRSAAKIHLLKRGCYAARSMERGKSSFEARHKVRHKVRCEELFTLEELKRAGGRIKANTAPGVNGLSNEILKEVIGAYPEILLEAFKSSLRKGRFFVDWKEQRLVLLRKSNKLLGVASSYRPICLLDTMGKLLEKLILQRLQALLVGQNGLLEKQFGFRKGSSTVDAIQAVVNIATNAKKGNRKCKGFRALMSIDIRNTFNTARWNICIEVMMRKKVPDYLLRIIDDYRSDRWVICEGDKWSLNEEMTCGAPQGSRVGPLVWNVMYDDFLRMELPAGTSIIGIADDALVVSPLTALKS